MSVWAHAHGELLSAASARHSVKRVATVNVALPGGGTCCELTVQLSSLLLPCSTLVHGEILDGNGNVHNEFGHSYPPRKCRAIINCADQQDEYVYGADGLDSNHSYTPTFTFHGFRYVGLFGWPTASTTAQLSIDSITCYQTYTYMEPGGSVSFNSSYQQLNQIQAAVVATQKSNMFGIPSDCPTREKRGWMGDAQVGAYWTRGWMGDAQVGLLLLGLWLVLHLGGVAGARQFQCCPGAASGLPHTVDELPPFPPIPLGMHHDHRLLSLIIPPHWLQASAAQATLNLHTSLLYENWARTFYDQLFLGCNLLPNATLDAPDNGNTIESGRAAGAGTGIYAVDALGDGPKGRPDQYLCCGTRTEFGCQAGSTPYNATGSLPDVSPFDSISGWPGDW